MLYKNSTVVDPDSLEYKEFKDILKKDNEIGNKVLLYVYLLCDLSHSNPIRDVTYLHRQEEALLIAFGNDCYNIEKELGEDWNKLTVAAIKCYNKKIVKEDEKDIYAYDKKMDQFRFMLLETVPRIEKNEGMDSISYTTNIDIINDVLENIVSLIQTKASIVSMIVQGTIPKHLRGGLSPLSSGKVNTTKSSSK